MSEMKVEVLGKGKNAKLVIELPIDGQSISKSGKSITVATTRGNQQSDCEWNGKPITVGVNAYVKRD